MKLHLEWIRVSTAAVATVVAGIAAQPAAAQYVPYRPIPQQAEATPAAAPQPAQAPAVQNPYTPYTAYRPQPQYQAPATSYRTTPTTAYQTPTNAQYKQPTATYPQTAQTAVPYPTTAYGAYPYVAQQQPVEAMPAPMQPSTPAAQPSNSAPMGSGATTGNMPMAEGMGASQPCGCNGVTAYGAGDYYNAPGCGCNNGSGYPDCSGISQYFGNDSCNENQWFGGVYFLDMARTRPSEAQFTVQVDHSTAPDPYYPRKSVDIITTDNIDTDFRPGVEVRVGSTFTIGSPCSACESGCGGYGFGYPGCNGCNTCGCSAPTTYAWEVAWWGLEDDCNSLVRSDDVTSQIRIYGVKNFVGLQYDRDGAGGAYGYRPVNYYYGYNMPIPAPPAPSGTSGLDGGNYIGVLAQRVYNNFKVQNLELNIIRFPMCAAPCGGCGGCNGDAGDCNGGCGCGAPSCFQMYGSCGVRYFHIDDSLAYDTEFGEWSGGAYDHPTYDGFTFDNSNELCYDIDINNNLVGPQLGWTMDYSYCCRWNVFLNSTFGIFDNHMTQWQRMWSGGGGTVQFAGTGESFNVRSNKDNVSFLGELRAGVAYDLTCHWRAVAAYRAVAMTGIATSTGQIPDNFSSRAEVAQINSDNSLVVHGVQVGAECRY